jgi:hypothetical protein
MTVTTDPETRNGWAMPAPHAATAEDTDPGGNAHVLVLLLEE